MENFPTKFQCSDFESLLSLINTEKKENYEYCINIGRILKFHSDDFNNFFEIWVRFCNKCSNLNKEKCRSEWKLFKKSKEFNFLSLINLVMDECENDIFKRGLYNDVIVNLSIKAGIEKVKPHFPNNNLDIGNIIHGPHDHFIDILDEYCPIEECKHETSQNYLHLNTFGLCMRCHDSGCRYKTYPEKPIHLSNIKMIFNINNSITINNTINGETLVYDEDTTNGLVIFKDEVLNKLILDSLSCTDSTISEVVYHLTKEDYFCTSNGTWYQFLKNKWKITTRIHEFLTDDVAKYYKTVKHFLKETNGNKHLITLANKVIKMLQGEKTTSILKKTGSRFQFFDVENEQKFEDRLDSIPYLVGFKNGVFDLENGEFRSTIKEDMISMTTKYDFPLGFSKEKDSLFKFLEDIFPVKEDKEYFFNLFVYWTYRT